MYKDSLLHPVKLSLPNLPRTNLMEKQPVWETNRCSTGHRPHMETEGSLPSSQKQCSLMAKLCKGKGKTARHYTQSVIFSCFCSHITFSKPALSSDRVWCAAITELLQEKLQREIRSIVVSGKQLWYSDRHISPVRRDHNEKLNKTAS
jgi:hypothetical protein